MQNSKVPNRRQLPLHFVYQLGQDRPGQTLEGIVTQIGLAKFERADSETPSGVLRVMDYVTFIFHCFEQVVSG
jgi:hypothetical protein